MTLRKRFADVLTCCWTFSAPLICPTVTSVLHQKLPQMTPVHRIRYRIYSAVFSLLSNIWYSSSVPNCQSSSIAAGYTSIITILCGGKCSFVGQLCSVASNDLNSRPVLVTLMGSLHSCMNACCSSYSHPGKTLFYMQTCLSNQGKCPVSFNLLQSSSRHHSPLKFAASQVHIKSLK